MIAWLAPGQGAERPGMGQEVAARWPEAARLMPARRPGLLDTVAAQEALTGVALGAAAALAAEGVPCHVVAGHSVGELAAWSVAGGCSGEEALALARARGEAMRAAAAASPGGMWAFSLEELPNPLPRGVVLACRNPDQYVVSGAEPPPNGRPVPTSGPWHHPVMAAAIPAFRAALAEIPRRALRVPVASNRDGRWVRSDAEIRELLVGQLALPVQWTAVLDSLRLAGCSEVVLLGPGKALAAQLRAHGSWARIHRTDRATDLLATARALAV